MARVRSTWHRYGAGCATLRRLRGHGGDVPSQHDRDGRWARPAIHDAPGDSTHPKGFSVGPAPLRLRTPCMELPHVAAWRFRRDADPCGHLILAGIARHAADETDFRDRSTFDPTKPCGGGPRNGLLRRPEQTRYLGKPTENLGCA